jgi:hypothetical protein
MDHHDPAFPYSGRDLQQLGGGLVVPARSDGLQDEATFWEVGGLGALPDLVCGETVAVCGEGRYDVLEDVGGGEIGGRVEVLFDVFYLCVDGFWNEEVGAVVEVLEESLGVLGRYWCGYLG